jgi:Tfp pilus assembly protein PilV
MNTDRIFWRTNRATARRAGFALPEAIMATALALAVLVGVAQLLAMVAGQRRLARQHAVAVLEAGNLMEQLMARPWPEIDPKTLAAVQLSEPCRQCLPEARLRVDVAPEDPDTKRIRIEIDWRTASGRPVEPIRLLGWKSRGEEAGP